MQGPHFARSRNASSDVIETCELILDYCREPQLGMLEIVRLVDSDPSVARKIIRSANATDLGLRHIVTTAEQAVAVLGSRRIGSLMTRFIKEQAKKDNFEYGRLKQETS